MTRFMAIAATLLAFACSDEPGTGDGGVDATADSSTDTGGLDSGTDTGGDDVGPSDSGLDADPDATPDASDAAPVDAGPRCEASSCGDRVCGRSACGYPCGECLAVEHCTAMGSCTDVAPPGDLCRDAFGVGVVEGGEGYRVCPTDDTLLQRCTCSGGGVDAWIGCGDCETIVAAGPRGSRCTDDVQCAGGVCHPVIGLCGESCGPAVGTPCPAGLVCGVPGDVAGVCLDECTTCGGDECGAGMRCAPAGDGAGNVCVPAGYAWHICA